MHDVVERTETSIWTFGEGTRTQQIQVLARSMIPDAGAQKVVLIRGGGIGRIPDYLAAPAVASGQLVRIFPELKGELIEIHALYPSHRSLSAKVRVFIDALGQHIVNERASL